jgi:hypothetical protein
VLATHTSFTVAPSPTRRFQVYVFTLRAAHNRAGTGVKHSTRVVRGAASPLPALIQPRGVINGQHELGLSALLSTISNTRHGHSPHSNTLRAAFRCAPASHGVSPIAMLEGHWAGQGYVYYVEHSHTKQLSLTATRWCPQRVVAGARRPRTSARRPSSSAPRSVHRRCCLKPSAALAALSSPRRRPVRSV